MKPNFRDYEVSDNDSYSSDFLNQVISDFNNNITQLYMEYQLLVEKYDAYITNVGAGLDWLTEQAAITASGTYAITGYGSPVSTDGIDTDTLFGEFYLEAFNIESKVGRYLDESSVSRAYESNKVYCYIDDQWVLDNTAQIIIDNKNDIWVKEHTEDELEISVTLSDTENIANMFEIFPFGGTLIKSISWKTSSGEYTTQTVNSKFPIKLVGVFNFANELKILMGGVDKTTHYYYGIRYVDIYRCDFANEGIITYDIGNFTEISEITLNDDYISEDLKLERPVRIEVLSDDESVIYYDSNTDPFPIQTSVAISETAVPLKMQITLYKTENVTPVIKTVTVE